MTRHLIDPELLQGLDFMAVFESVNDHNYAERAAAMNVAPELPPYNRSDVEETERFIPGLNNAPDLRVLLYRSTKTRGPLPVFIHIHGGGYVFCTPEMTAPGNTRTASELECLVVSVDYRLAPETRSPGQVEDCYAALKWLHENADELNIDTSRIAVGGDSAGGGIGAALALMVRDRGEYSLCFQMLIYPMLDDRTCVRKDVNPHVGEFVWNPESNYFGWKNMLGTEPGGDLVSSYSAPARADDLSGLPPAYIAVGALDLFLEENIAYATRLLKAGVPTELHILPGAYHGFEIATSARLSRESEAERRAALAKAFNQT